MFWLSAYCCRKRGGKFACAGERKKIVPKKKSTANIIMTGNSRAGSWVRARTLASTVQAHGEQRGGVATSRRPSHSCGYPRSVFSALLCVCALPGLAGIQWDKAPPPGGAADRVPGRHPPLCMAADSFECEPTAPEDPGSSGGRKRGVV
jgi:hypothetical protein